jgi:hypothetical protein
MREQPLQHSRGLVRGLLVARNDHLNQRRLPEHGSAEQRRRAVRRLEHRLGAGVGVGGGRGAGLGLHIPGGPPTLP